jgi:hypothetical protein
MIYEFLKQNQILFITILGAITFALSIYLGFLIKKLREQDREHKTLLEEHREKLQEKAEYYKDSIIMISRATIQGQCETSEACVRIKKLLENFPEVEKETQFEIIQKMYEELSGFAYLDERKKLSKQDVFKQDSARFKVEEKYQDKFIQSLKVLVQRFESLT